MSTLTAIDLFAGLGGMTEGFEQAGVSVQVAANHWPIAVAIHALNHPDTDHRCQDLHQADWSTELLAAQGIPTSYQLPEKITQRDLCRAVGNAVPPPVAKAIARAIQGVS